jgi:drug/metabolite transporter (DMT)-like permease
LLSVVWLGKKLKAYNWAGMFLVLGGLILVGLSGFLDKSAASASASNPLVGDLIIVIAQVRRTWH